MSIVKNLAYLCRQSTNPGLDLHFVDCVQIGHDHVIP